MGERGKRRMKNIPDSPFHRFSDSFLFFMGGCMQFQSIDWKRGITLGVLAGIVWGWVATAVNAVRGAFAFENSLMHNLISFAIGGAVFCIVVNRFLGLLQRLLPFKSILFNAVLLF